MSQLEAMMNAADADDAVSEPAVEGAEGSPASPPSGEPDASSGADSEAAPADGEKAAADPKKPPPNDKLGARFAALAREKGKNLAHQQQLDATARQLAEREQSLGAREAQLTARLADAEKILTDPDKLFAHLENLGFRTPADLIKHAQRQWERPKPAPAEEDPSKRPLTRADLEAFQQRQAEAETYRTFVAMVGDDEKYEAAPLVFSEQEMWNHGDRIARELSRKGIPWTKEDIADAVDELARRDPRYAKLQKRAAKASGAPATSKPAPAGAAKAPVTTNGRQSSQAKTLSNEAATERANGAPPRLTHRERLQRLMSS